MIKNSELLEIIKNIHQVAFNGKDFYESEENKKNIGLKREKNSQMLGSRTEFDGFNISILGKTLILKYHTTIFLRDVYGKKLQSEIDQTMSDIVSYIKKEYKKIAGVALNLSPLAKESKILVQGMSGVRYWAQAEQRYTIGNFDVDAPVDGTEKKIDANIRKFVADMKK